MGKRKVNFECLECGFRSPGWLGKCPECSTWGSVREVPREPPGGKSGSYRRKENRPSLLSSISSEGKGRRETGVGEFDRVLGGGLVVGTTVLVAGDPGIGKSTLLLQVCASLAGKGERVLYVSGEESERQIKMRAGRLEIEGDEIYFMSETSVESIISGMEEVEPTIAVIDSIQTISYEGLPGVPGSVSQVRESSAHLNQFAKEKGISLLLVGHVTKEGSIAGPRLLEHMVDVVLHFEGEKGHPFRIVKGVKNRFGSVSEIGIFEMTAGGLQEVPDPSGIFSGSSMEPVPGMVVYPSLSGSRTVMVEVQALVARSFLPVPRRVVVGLDPARSQILSTILEKQCSVKLFNSDLYLNVAGGLKIQDTGADLAIVVAILSGVVDKPVPREMTAFGEVGLGGEVRPVQLERQRIAESVRMGFKRILLPAKSADICSPAGKEVELVAVSGVKGLKSLIS